MKVCMACGERHERADWSCPVCGWTPPQHLGIICLAPIVNADEAGFKLELFKHLVYVEARHSWFTSRNRLLTWAVRTYFPRARNLLEIGCGTGFVLHGLSVAFPNLRLVGGDISCEGLAFARRVPDATLIQMDARRIPFEKEFDVIGAFDLLEHVEEDDAVLGQMHQAAKPGGGIIVTVPQHRWLWRPYDVLSGHRRRYIRREIKEKIERAGFRIVRVTSFVSLVLPLLAMMRFSKKKDDDLMTELKIDPFADAYLEHVLGLERLLIRGGISFPAGGSLLVIASRK
jgi:SAM-dependent methyltransferase